MLDNTSYIIQKKLNETRRIPLWYTAVNFLGSDQHGRLYQLSTSEVSFTDIITVIISQKRWLRWLLKSSCICKISYGVAQHTIAQITPPRSVWGGNKPTITHHFIDEHQLPALFAGRQSLSREVGGVVPLVWNYPIPTHRPTLCWSSISERWW